MILDNNKEILERTDDLGRWMTNLTAERNHLNFRDRRSYPRSSSSRKSPSSQETANIAPSPAPSTAKKTGTADVSGDTFAPQPLHH
jgi:hypothetical protein